MHGGIKFTMFLIFVALLLGQVDFTSFLIAEAMILALGLVLTGDRPSSGDSGYIGYREFHK